MSSILYLCLNMREKPNASRDWLRIARPVDALVRLMLFTLLG